MEGGRDRQDAGHKDHEQAHLLRKVWICRDHERGCDAGDERKQYVGFEQVGNPEKPSAIAHASKNLKHAEKQRHLSKCAQETLAIDDRQVVLAIQLRHLLHVQVGLVRILLLELLQLWLKFRHFLLANAAAISSGPGYREQQYAKQKRRGDDGQAQTQSRLSG